MLWQRMWTHCSRPNLKTKQTASMENWTKKTDRLNRSLYEPQDQPLQPSGTTTTSRATGSTVSSQYSASLSLIATSEERRGLGHILRPEHIGERASCRD